MNWEIVIDMSTLMCIKWITNKNLLYKKINKIKFKKKRKKIKGMFSIISGIHAQYKLYLFIIKKKKGLWYQGMKF